MTNFCFSMHEDVVVVDSGESGEVVGRAEHAYSENVYLVDYVDTTGRMQSSWFGEHLLERQE